VSGHEVGNKVPVARGHHPADNHGMQGDEHDEGDEGRSEPRRDILRMRRALASKRQMIPGFSRGPGAGSHTIRAHNRSLMPETVGALAFLYVFLEPRPAG
jgi:hypothetical protein